MGKRRQLKRKKDVQASKRRIFLARINGISLKGNGFVMILQEATWYRQKISGKSMYTKTKTWAN